MLRNTLKIAWVLSGAMSLVFACDVLLWTVGVNILEPMQSLLRAGIWLVPFALCSYALYRSTPENNA